MGDACDTTVIAMDYEENLPLSRTEVGQEYYKRQLWIYNFCIHDNDRATAFLYAEHYAAKKVLTRWSPSWTTKKEDLPPGQHKNRTNLKLVASQIMSILFR